MRRNHKGTKAQSFFRGELWVEALMSSMRFAAFVGQNRGVCKVNAAQPLTQSVTCSLCVLCGEKTQQWCNHHQALNSNLSSLCLSVFVVSKKENICLV